MKLLLAILCLSGCAAQTVVRNREGVKLLQTNATVAQLAFRGSDGTTLVLTAADHVEMQKALALTITQRANGIAGMISALAAGAFFR